VTVRELSVVVAGERGVVPGVLPVPHSYTAPEPVDALSAVKVMFVDLLLHIVALLEANPVGAVGGVFTVTNALFEVAEQAVSPLLTTTE
jgi:hypothetical protein